MKKLIPLLVVGLLSLFASTAWAAFTPGMTADQVKIEVKAQKDAGKSALDIAQAGSTASVTAGDLAKGMLASGFDASATILALLDAGFVQGVVRAAAVAAGVPEVTAANIIANAPSGTGQSSTSGNSGKSTGAGGTGSGGGGKASGS